MSSDRSRPGSSASRWIAAALSSAWIVTILPALPLLPGHFPRLPVHVPDWRDRYLSAAATVGQMLGGLCWSLAAGVSKGADPAHAVPLSTQGWLADATAWGRLLGMVVAAALPPWIVWVVFRGVGRAKTRDLGSPPEPAPPVQDLPSADPSLAIAVGWSIALLAAFTISVIRELSHPVPTALMMPPARGSRGDTGAPISEWCAYSFHPRAGECEAALAKWSRGPVYHSVEGFSFVGARCLAVADYSLVRPRQAAIDHTADVLARAFGTRARVTRDAEIGREHANLAVLAASPDGKLLLALDVAENASNVDDDARAARIAAAGAPEYWRIELHPSRDTLSGDSVRVWQHPDPATGRYFLVSGSGRNPDTSLRLAAVPDVRIPVDDLLPLPCSAVRAEAAARKPTVPGPSPCTGLALVLSGGASPPTLLFSDIGSDGVAARLLFTATSERPAPEFDPAAKGLAIQIGGPVFGEAILEATLVAGPSWSHQDAGSWTYRDAAGRTAGITDVAIRSLDGGRLAWEIQGERGRYPASLEEFRRWGSFAVRLRAGSGGTEPCGSVFFRTASAESGACREEGPGTVRCVAPDAAQSGCKAEDPDGLIPCTLRKVAQAEDVFFASHGRYFSGKCEDLLETTLPIELFCLVMARTTDFTAIANHPRSAYAKGCQWESASPAGRPPLRCS